MLLATLFSILFSIVFASSSINTSAICSKELEEIAYSPTGPYKEYLHKISKELEPLAFFYDTPQANQIIQNFVVRYGVYVQVYDIMGNSYLYDPSTVTPIYQPNIGRAGTFTIESARVVMNLGAYSNSAESYSYSFLSFNCQTGVMYEVTVGIFKPAPFQIQSVVG